MPDRPWTRLGRAVAVLFALTCLAGCRAAESASPGAPSTTSPPTSAVSPALPTSDPTSAGPAKTATQAATWWSGASGEGVADGQFATWRGTAVGIAGTWADTSGGDQVALYQLASGGEYADWSGSLDIAVGAIFADQGESWSAAADGAYDARWATMLEKLQAKWSERPRGTLYIRFAHEWNGSWSPWAVAESELGDFITAWRRFHSWVNRLVPGAKLVFCTNGDTNGFDYDWRRGWPGDEYVDVYATDWYSELVMRDEVDAFGGPVGLEQHRQFAARHGKSFALPEWGNRYSASGDAVAFVEFVHAFATSNGGRDAGQLVYDIYFNVRLSPNDFAIFPRVDSLAPSLSDAYRRLF